MANNTNVEVGVVTVSGKVFEAPKFHENGTNKFATLKVTKNNGKDKEGNWKPSTFFSVLLSSYVAAKKDGTPSWLIDKLTKGTHVTLTGRLEAGAWLDKTNNPQPQLSLVVSDYRDITLQGGGEAAATTSSAADVDDDDPPF